MVPISEPVKYVFITFKYYYWTADRNDKRWYHDRFDDINQLRDYFKRFPAAASLVAYGSSPVGSVFAFEGKLLLEWADQTTTVVKEFRTAQQFVEFLKEHRPIARALKYE